jgi:hypothetical protein
MTAVIKGYNRTTNISFSLTVFFSRLPLSSSVETHGVLRRQYVNNRGNKKKEDCIILCSIYALSYKRNVLADRRFEKLCTTSRGSVRNTRGLGPTMTARGQSIGISIGMLPQTLIMSRLDQLLRLGARI